MNRHEIAMLLDNRYETKNFSTIIRVEPQNC